MAREDKTLKTSNSFTFKIATADFNNEQEKAQEFFQYIYGKETISDYIKDAVIKQYKREKEGVDEKVLNELTSFHTTLQELDVVEDIQTILSFIKLFGKKDIMEFIHNRGIIDENKIAKEVASQVKETLVNDKIADLIADKLARSLAVKNFGFAAPMPVIPVQEENKENGNEEEEETEEEKPKMNSLGFDDEDDEDGYDDDDDDE